MKTVWERILVLLLAALLLAGCAKSGKPAAEAAAASETAAPSLVPAEPTPEPTEKPTPEPTEEPTPEPGPFEADYALLWEILETDYPYLPYLREKGIDVDGIRETYAKLVKDTKNVKTFAEIIGKVFASLRNTAHLHMIPEYLFKDMYGIYVLSPELKDDLFCAPWRDVMMQAAEIGYYTAPKEYNSGLSSMTGVYSDVKVQYYKDCKTLCFSVPTFDFYSVEHDKDVFINAIKQYPEAENIVFDITRNSGGDDRYWKNNIVAPFGKDYTFEWREFYRSSPENERIVTGWMELYNTSEAEDAPAWATAYGLDRFFCMSAEVKGFEAIRSDAKRWVLVSSTVYSSSEEFVCFCKATGWATIAGTHTGGDGLGFDPVIRLLPDSGLLFRFCMDAGENPDGTMNIEGTTPDVILETADVTHLLDLIREEQGH